MEKNIKYFFILCFIFVIFFSFSAQLPQRLRGGFFSDSGAYYAIIQSIAYDLDLEWSPDRTDITRIKERFREGPMGVFLKKGKDGRIFYAKSFLYPLFAAPFFRLFHEHGLLLFNGLMILLSLWMGYRLLSRFHDDKKSFFFSLAFVLASVLPIYIWWIQADLFNFFVMFAALFFFFYPFQNPRWFYLSAFFFSVAVYSKPSNIIAAGCIYLILLLRRQWKRFVVLFLMAVIFMCGFVLVYYSQTGEINYMGGERRPFVGVYPFEKPEYTFESNQRIPTMSADTFWSRFFISPRMLLLNSFYFIFGRFTGLFIYFFPALFCLLLFIYQKKSADDWLVLAAILGSVFFFLTVTGDNYFGGGGSVGNRYFLSIFPLFFFLGFRGRILRFTLLPVGLALIFLSGAFTDGVLHSQTARSTGISFPVNLFPPEKTQYLCLPTNENPDAFGKFIRFDEETNSRYWLYFLNDNFQPIEGTSFWTHGDRLLELFLAAPAEVREFEVFLETPVKGSRVLFQIEHQKRRLQLQQYRSNKITFKKVPGLLVKDKYIYHIRIKSSTSYSPYLVDPYNRDKRILGVKTHIRLNY